jgi:Mg2+-importing ATPase
MRRPPPPIPASWWGLPATEVGGAVASGPQGLAGPEAERRLALYGPNAFDDASRGSAFALLASQFRSPLVLILLFASVVSLVAAEWVDAAVVLGIVLGSTALGFTQEYIAGNVIEKLRSTIAVTCTVLRDGAHRELPVADIVQGDVVVLTAGSLIPADGIVLEARDCFVNQSTLTGEGFPSGKLPGVSGSEVAFADRGNCLYMGTSVASGAASMLVVVTGRATMLGQIAGKLETRAAETDFEQGIRRFGNLLTRIMLVMVLAVLAINIFMQRPPIDSLLFALALAVGLTPELLPAIISITLAHGARRMAKLGVVVRRLNAIENLGSMDVLCTDKTGTLTLGVVELDAALDADGADSANVLRLAGINARLQAALPNPLDGVVVAACDKAAVDFTGVVRLDEIPYDFVRKRLSVVANTGGARPLIVTKGALDSVLGVCDRVRGASGDALPLGADHRTAIAARHSAWSAAGYRVLGVATRETDATGSTWSPADERALCFEGFLLFFDPPKPDAAQTLAELRQRGVSVRIITGDSRNAALHVAEALQVPVARVITGAELAKLSELALVGAAQGCSLFAEVDPNQKETIIRALQRAGHVVGYLGDGINDALALHRADVGLSVSTAVDVAKGAADLVLLQKDLKIIRDGIDEGRRTFVNTLKYILTTVSANFGNMISMAVASLYLPFLPLLASQILLNNFLSDIPGMAIASDHVDPEAVSGPRRWDTRFIRNYMILFGALSSVFDFLAFGVLLWVFHAGADEFRTGWFLESLLTELAVAMVVRTRRAFYRSRPGRLLLWSTVGVFIVALALPYLPFATIFGFVPLPPTLLLGMIGLTLAYVVAAEFTKRRFQAWLARE